MPLVNHFLFKYARPHLPAISRYRRFFVKVFHQGKLVSEEPILARDLQHAHYMGAYIAPTVARETIHPRDFDRSRVHWQVIDPSKGYESSERGTSPVSNEATKQVS